MKNNLYICSFWKYLTAKNWDIMTHAVSYQARPWLLRTMPLLIIWLKRFIPQRFCLPLYDTPNRIVPQKWTQIWYLRYQINLLPFVNSLLLKILFCSFARDRLCGIRMLLPFLRLFMFYIVGHWWGIFCVLNVNLYFLQGCWLFTYSVECKALYYV